MVKRLKWVPFRFCQSLHAIFGYFVRQPFVAQIRVKMCVRAVVRAVIRAVIHAVIRDKATLRKILVYEHWNYLKEHAYHWWACPNCEPKRLKLKLGIVEKPKNRVHRLTDSNVYREKVCAQPHVRRYDY